MKRQEILDEIKSICLEEYSKIEDWIHGINHIEDVVSNGRKLAKMEKLKSKDAFLLEIACWLHDIGRVGEGIGLKIGQSNHAEHSYWKSKKILKRYERPLGREPVFKILQAVREHSLPVLKHPENKINCLLLDSDRGGNLDIRGVFRMLNYMKVVETVPVLEVEQARGMLDDLYNELVEKKKVNKALGYLEIIRDWYYGNKKQKLSKKKVTPLYSDSARELYRDGIAEVERFIGRLRECDCF